MDVRTGSKEWDATAIVVATTVLPEGHPSYPSSEQVDQAVLALLHLRLLDQGYDDEGAFEFLAGCCRYEVFAHEHDGRVMVYVHHEPSEQVAVLSMKPEQLSTAYELIAEAM